MRVLAFFAVTFVLVACTGTAPLHPKAVELNRTGAEALASGDLETAEARFALALEYHPRFVEALTNLGLVELQRGNFERARLLFERSCRYNTDLAQPHHALGVLAERERRPDVAAEHYREALRVNPGFGPARANLARVLFAAGLYDDAREQFARLVASDPGDRAGALGLAESLLRLGRDEESDEVVERARRSFGELPELVILVARSELRRGAYDRAEERLAPLLGDDDDVARAAWSFTASARLARGDDEGALAAAERTFELDRHDPVGTWVVAMALRKARDPRALTWLERAHQLAPSDRIVAEELERARAEGEVQRR